MNVETRYVCRLDHPAYADADQIERATCAVCERAIVYHPPTYATRREVLGYDLDLWCDECAYEESQSRPVVVVTPSDEEISAAGGPS